MAIAGPFPEPYWHLNLPRHIIIIHKGKLGVRAPVNKPFSNATYFDGIADILGRKRVVCVACRRGYQRAWDSGSNSARTSSSGSASTLKPDAPTTVSAATIALTIASSVACIVAANMAVNS